MTIREATEQDIPEIVALLKRSLGESLLPKSEAYWRWKHIDNPFGKSPVLLATDSSRIIGVRAMMRWDWVHKGVSWKAVRAVDTATDPAWQGKGVFRELTLQAIDRCKELGISFVFNTPNEKSMPGYLKMGWETAGRLPIGLKPIRPVSMVLQRFQLRKAITGSLPSAQRLSSTLSQTPDLLITPASTGYLQWRYLANPVVSYGVLGSGENPWAVARLKDSSWGKELRITEYLREQMGDQGLKSTGADYVSTSWLRSGRMGFRVDKGPMVTIRRVGDCPFFDELKSFKSWAPTLGDMELF